MGNQSGSGFHLILITIFSAATAYMCLGAQNMTVGCIEQEGLALTKFKHSFKYDFKMLSSWVGRDCCRWEGVHCDEATGSVVGLHLRGNNRGYFYSDVEVEYLVGDKMDSSLAELSHLKHLDMSGNDFQGTRIPEFIGSFKQLRYLNLSNAGFSGIIPHHIGNLSNLKVLDLGSSSFTNPLVSVDMAWVSRLSNLEHLDMSEVDLSRARNVDMILYTIPSLIELSFHGCRLSNPNLGPNLNSSRILPKIELLDLSLNFLEGQLPRFVMNMTSLAFLDLSSYKLSLVSDSVNLLNMFPSLSELHLSSCGLHTTHLSIAYLNFSAHLNVRYLDLSKNLLEGRFPSVLINMTSLRVLDLSENSMNSSIPFMPNLLELDISSNYFNRIEFLQIWRQCHLKRFWVSDNYFGGEMIGPSTNMSECRQYALETLYADGNYLNGSIPESVGRFTNLRVLKLMSNRLTGPVPKALGRLRLLDTLDLSINQLNGPIPTFHGPLMTLDISENKLNGSIPESLGSLLALTNLLLQSNQLTGSIPASLGTLASLQVFSVRTNLLNGTIPVSIGQLDKLTVLDISNNSFEGVVSEAHFANLSSLKTLDTTSNNKLTFNVSREWTPPFQLRTVRLSSCRIVDDLPQWFRTQRRLEELVLSNTSISGPLPTWFRKMPIIPVLDLSHNKLGGPLMNLPSGAFFNEFDVDYQGSLLLQDNLFNGPIPRSLCKLRHLILLDLSKNKLSGDIPRCIENLQSIMMLMLDSNGFSGVFPQSLVRVSSSMAWLKLNDNNFTGELPRDLANLRFLRVLDLGNNEFFGSIPEWIGENLTTLMVLRLHKNNFIGRIPESLCKNSYLQILDVAHNRLTGPIPRCFGDLSGMIEASQQDIRNGSFSSDENVIQVMKGVDLSYTKTLDLVFNMDLSSNKLTGEIPEKLTLLSLLVGLNLSHNLLTGGIPDTIGSMKSLTSLDLSGNKLTGTIPPSMAALNFLSHLNLSHNDFSGRIPVGNQLQTLTDPSIYAGNKDLCGAPLQKCSDHEDPTARIKDKYEEGNEPKKLWFYLDVMCGFATGFWGVIGVLLFMKQWRHKLFTIAEVAMDKIYVAVTVRVSIMMKGREAA